MYIHVNAQNEPVMPGDFNMDGVVSIHDALYWGLAHGQTGTTRPNADIEWTPQPATDWDESIRLVNNKFQDGNGDGLIDTFDLEALYQNFDSTHIYIIKDNDTVENFVDIEHYATESDDIRNNRYEVRVKDPTLHGIAFTFDYSNYGDAAIDAGVDISGLSIENDGIVVDVLQEDDHLLHVAVTRTDQTNIELGNDPIVNIVICEDIATLVDPPQVYLKNGEIITAGEERQIIPIATYNTPPPPVPECKVLWNGEQCLYQNGTINEEEVEFDYCFEGSLYEGKAGIEMGCRRWSGDDISGYDTLSFIIKTDVAGIGESVEFFIADISQNYSNKIMVNNLDTAFQKIEFPIEVLENDESVLQAIDWIYFEAVGESQLTIYVDDILLNGWLPLWNGQKCWYRDGTLNGEEVNNGQYSFERIINPYEWNHSAIGLHCEQDSWVNLSESDEIRFYAKADQPGKTFNFFASEAYREWFDCNTLNINDYIEGGELTEHYRLVTIPLDSLKNENCTLEKVQTVHFFNQDDIEFKFYIDDVHVYSENCMTSVEDPLTEYQQLIIYPNPASEFLSIHLHSRQSTQGEVRIFDMQGRFLDRLNIHLTAGQNTFTYAPTVQTTGVYVIHLESEYEFFIGKLVIGE